MIERLARTICGTVGCVEFKRSGRGSPKCGRECGGDLRMVLNEYGDAARQSLEAMREPTEAMVNAYCRLEDAEAVSGLVSSDAWQTMIDAALNPGDRT